MPRFAKERAVADPTGFALVDGDRILRWADVDDALNRCANLLLAADRAGELGPAHRIAVFAENAGETALAHLGGLLAGASSVPVNFHLTADEAAYILEDSQTAILFVGPGDRGARRRGGPRRRRRAGHRLAVRRRRRRDRLGRLARRRCDRRSTRRRAAATQPALHVRHHRATEGHRAAAHDVRRRRHDGRAPRRRWPPAASRGSAPISSSARCTTPVRCRACVCSAPASRR